MTERPILFSAPMVRAILGGTKSQTRRLVKPQFQSDAEPAEMSATTAEGWQTPGHSGRWWDDAAADDEQAIRCPYGVPGDRLWVRETWMDLHGTGIERRTGDRGRYAYGADTPAGSYGDEARKAYGLKWRPSIHMPRAASRLTLEVTGVRVERLQEISPADAIAEGIDRSSMFPWRPGEILSTDPDVSRYAVLWESINGAGSWAANPWVWAVSFRRVTP